MEQVLLSSLGLPIIVSAIVVFAASFVAWMVLPHHKSDWKKLPDEEGARAALKGVPPGEYTIPHAATSEEWKSEAWIAKAKEGPMGFVAIKPPGAPAMGKGLAQWLVYCLVVSLFVAYVTGRALGPGAEYLTVFQIAGTVAFLAYSSAHVSNSIWMGKSWRRTIKDLLDGLAYGLLTGGVFGWLWP